MQAFAVHLHARDWHIASRAHALPHMLILHDAKSRKAGETSNRAHAMSHVLLLQAAELALQSDDVRSQPLRVALLQQGFHMCPTAGLCQQWLRPRQRQAIKMLALAGSLAPGKHRQGLHQHMMDRQSMVSFENGFDPAA